MKKIAAILAMSLVLGGVAYASIPDSGGVIHGCYKTTGNVKELIVIDSATQSCPSGYTALNWSQTGPQGAAGADGATGATGPEGPAAEGTLRVIHGQDLVPGTGGSFTIGSTDIGWGPTPQIAHAIGSGWLSIQKTDVDDCGLNMVRPHVEVFMAGQPIWSGTYSFANAGSQYPIGPLEFHDGPGYYALGQPDGGAQQEIFTATLSNTNGCTEDLEITVDVFVEIFTSE